MYVVTVFSRWCCATVSPAFFLAVFSVLAISLTIGGMNPATAHHARPEYDRASQLTIEGTVREYEMVNPHVWIHLNVPMEGGEIEEWSFEGGSVARLNRAGWTRDMLKPGDKVSVVFNPRRDSSLGGLFRAVTTASGEYHSATRRRSAVRFR